MLLIDLIFVKSLFICEEIQFYFINNPLPPHLPHENHNQAKDQQVQYLHSQVPLAFLLSLITPHSLYLHFHLLLLHHLLARWLQNPHRLPRLHFRLSTFYYPIENVHVLICQPVLHTPPPHKLKLVLQNILDIDFVVFLLLFLFLFLHLHLLLLLFLSLERP